MQGLAKQRFKASGIRTSHFVYFMLQSRRRRMPKATHIFQKIFNLTLLLFLICFAAAEALAQQVLVTWDKNPVEEQVNAYIVCYGKTSRNDPAFTSYDVEVNVGDINSYSVDVNPDNTYYFALKAKNTSDLTSDYSLEKVRAPAPAPTFSLTASADVGGAILPEGVVVVDQGGSQRFDITPDAGYLVSDVLVDGVSQGNMSAYTFSNVTADHAIEAFFEPEPLPVFTLTASAGANGSISPSGNVTVVSGDSASFSITPDAGYRVLDVTVDGASIGSVSDYVFSSVSADHTIFASFELIPAQTFTVAASSGPNGSISPQGEVIVEKGKSLTFTIAADAGYQVANVLVDDVSQGAATSYVFSNITAGHTILATFERVPPKLFTIAAGAGANGSISPSGDSQVVEGGSLVFTITPDAGYQIADVLVDGTSQGALASYEFTSVTANHAISASFELIPPKTYLVTINLDGAGVVEPGGTVAATEGQDLQINFFPDENFGVADVLLDGKSLSLAKPTETYTLTNIGSNCTIDVLIVPLPSAPVDFTLTDIVPNTN